MLAITAGEETTYLALEAEEEKVGPYHLYGFLMHDMVSPVAMVGFVVLPLE